jgi:hypothetical protein
MAKSSAPVDRPTTFFGSTWSFRQDRRKKWHWERCTHGGCRLRAAAQGFSTLEECEMDAAAKGWHRPERGEDVAATSETDLVGYRGRSVSR